MRRRGNPARWAGASLGAALLLMLAAGAPQAGAVAPQAAAGARYDGVGPARSRSFVRFNRAGTKLVAYDLTIVASCSDGKRRKRGFLSQGERATPLAPAGTFSFDSGIHRFSLRTKVPRPVPGKGHVTFTGTIVDADTVTVTMTDTFTSKRLKCRGTGTLTLYRDGTPQSPLRNEDLATGSYRAAGRGIKILKLQVIAPGRYVSAFGFGTTVSCRDGYSYGETGAYFPFGLDRSGETAYRISETGPLVVTRTVRGRERATLSIRFYSDGGRYLVRGRMTIRSTLRRRGKRTRCSASRPFTGAFATGPAA